MNSRLSLLYALPQMGEYVAVQLRLGIMNSKEYQQERLRKLNETVAKAHAYSLLYEQLVEELQFLKRQYAEAQAHIGILIAINNKYHGKRTRYITFDGGRDYYADLRGEKGGTGDRTP